jgi:hypothetical protein
MQCQGGGGARERNEKEGAKQGWRRWTAMAAMLETEKNGQILVFTIDVGGRGRARKGRKAERNSVRSLATQERRWRSVVAQQWRCGRDCCCAMGETKVRWERGREWSGAG